MTNNVEGSIQTKNLVSEIINDKKQLILQVDQTSDYIYPNKEYEYDIFCKNVSNELIEDVHIQVINPSNVLIDEDEYNQGIPIGDIPQQQSHLLRLKARCSKPGIYVVHFLCFGIGTGVFAQTLTISCNYTSYDANTTHRIHIYNFTPYEEKYILQSEDYNKATTRLRKIQKLPYKAKENPFSFIKTNLNQGIIADESQNYLDQKEILYNNQAQSDEHNYQYISRENFNKSSIEHFEGRNLVDIINQINDKSKFFKAILLKTGTNHLLNDFKKYNPDGFLYRFGLMSSELYHYLGVLPEYSYMNDILFRWAPDDTQPLNLYPKKVAMNWNTKKWSGHGYHVYKVYTDEYKNEIIHTSEFEPLFEFIKSFDLEQTAQEYINKEYEFDTTNIYYTETEEGIVGIRKYKYIIKESYLDNGVFYIHIPLDKIPSNFYIPDIEEINAIVQRTKPYGMKPLIRYIANVRFNHNMSLKTYPTVKPKIKLHLGKYDKLRYSILSYKYKNIIETICVQGNQFTTRETLKLIPCGDFITNKFHVNFKNHKINMKGKEPRGYQNLKHTMNINNEAKKCSVDNDLSQLSSINQLLYQNNFEKMSFMLSTIPTTSIPDKKKGIPRINAVNYKLWIQSLNDIEHSREWDVEIANPNAKEKTYCLTNNKKKKFDFIKLSLANKQLTQPGIETGIGFRDISGKLYGISAEYNEHLGLCDIKYTTSMQNTFKIEKKILSDLTGIAYKIVVNDTSSIILFFVEKKIDGKTTYQYFHHVVAPLIKSIFCFTRNEKNISSIKNLSNIVSIGTKTNTPVYFNTPQYYDSNEYDPRIIITDENNMWTNISRIDKNEHSYATVHNMTNDTQEINNIQIHFDDIKIPEDAIIKNINIHAILESNVNKNIYYCLRNQDGFITPQSSVNQISLHPTDIESYPYANRNQKYYKEQYNIAKTNNIENSIKFFEKKIKENKTFDNTLNLSLDFLDEIDSSILIKKDFWCELSDFTTEYYSFNDIEDCYFIIEGYNHGGEVDLISCLTHNKTTAPTSNTKIPSGYFIKHIPLKWYNKFFASNTHIKFRFKGLNDTIEIFDLYENLIFKDKQSTNISFNEYDSFNIEGKKIIDFDVLNKDTMAYKFKNGFTVKLDFDDLEAGEYYRIYSLVLNIVYQAQSIDFLANRDNSRNIEYTDNFIVVGGNKNAPYLSGMFFNDMPSVFQYQSTSNKDNAGIELTDTLYQSFIAEDDNITSITLYPNGFVGNPDLNLKLGLYENQGHTPAKLIKETNITGWSKANKILKNKSVITYNFNVNNLKIGERYWLKLEVENPKNNNYYLLKYIDSPQQDFKLLTKINNNLINTLGCLKFQINSIHLYKSFNNIPISQNDLNNPNIFIGLNRGQGYIKNLRIKK